MFKFYLYLTDRRARAGGEMGCDGKVYRGGEFLPFYVPRAEMPQINEEDEHALCYFAATRGVAVDQVVAQPNDLRFHQRVAPINGELVSAAAVDKPILISRDGYILDGNHRAKAHQLLGTPVNALRVDLDFAEAMELLLDFPKTYEVADAQG